MYTDYACSESQQTLAHIGLKNHSNNPSLKLDQSKKGSGRPPKTSNKMGDLGQRFICLLNPQILPYRHSAV